MLLSGGCVFCVIGIAPCVESPGLRENIQNVLAKEQEIVGQRNDTEEIVREGIGKEIQTYNTKIDEGKNPCLHRDDEKQQEMSVRVHGGITQKQTQIQICHICLPTENQTPDIHHYHTGKIEQVKFECSPAVFHGTAQRPVAKQGNGD